MARITYLTGPVRSGKSRRAVELAQAWGDGVVFVATYRTDAADAEMRARVARHRAERPAWRTIEAPDDVASARAARRPPPTRGVGGWRPPGGWAPRGASDDAILAAWAGQLGRLHAAPWPVVIVGNEIGWSPVPGHPVLRRFRDLAGSLAQATAATADEAWLLIAGCPVRLK